MVAVAERYLDRQAAAVETCRGWGLPVYEDIFTMLDAVDVEAVVIACPHHFHAEYTLGSLERGLHVMCEKPVTVCVQEARQVAASAAARGLWSGVDFQYTCYPHSRRFKEFLVSGGLGELREVVGVLAWKRLDEYYTRAHWVGKCFVEGRPCFDGVLMNQAVHLLNSALQMGSTEPTFATPRSMQAELYAVHAGIETDDLACLRASLGDATLTVYATTCNMNGPERTTLEIVGTRGTASWSDGGAVARLNTGEEIAFDEPATRNEIHLNFAACIRGEAGALHAPAHEGLKATLAVDAAYASAGQVTRLQWDNVADIGALIDTAAEGRQLFSEMDIPWARAGQAIDLPSDWSFDPSPFA
jgi:predicted dehydrogenase